MKHFKDDEFHDIKIMNQELLIRLDAFREYIGLSIIVTSSNEPTRSHNKKSQHYINNAVDIVVPEWKGSIFSLYLLAERFGFTGIGIYPKWRYKGKITGGLHLDMRPVVGFQGSRWIGYPEKVEGTQYFSTKYYALNMKNLVTLKIVNPKNGSNA